MTLRQSAFSSEQILVAEGRVGANAGRVAQTTYEGASYVLVSPLVFNRLIVRFTAITLPVTLECHLYQLVAGSGSVVRRVATCSFTPGAAGAQNAVITPTEGTVTLSPGLVYVLFGRSSAGGSGTFRTFTLNNNSLLSSDMDADTHPVAYTTTIAANTTPATFDPRTVAGGGQATESTLDVVPILRLKLV